MAIEGKKRTHPNLDVKIGARREFVYFQWLRGKNNAEIGKMLEEMGWQRGTSRQSVEDDLHYVIERLSAQPRDMEKIRQNALMELEMDRQQVLRVADSADPKIAWRYWTIAANINKLILERYTQTGGRETVGVPPSVQEREKGVIDFLIEKLGPEGVADFEEWWKLRMEATAVKRIPPS